MAMVTRIGTELRTKSMAGNETASVAQRMAIGAGASASSTVMAVGLPGLDEPEAKSAATRGG
jgi:hypothetical protein